MVCPDSVSVSIFSNSQIVYILCNLYKLNETPNHYENLMNNILFITSGKWLWSMSYIRDFGVQYSGVRSTKRKTRIKSIFMFIVQCNRGWNKRDRVQLEIQYSSAIIQSWCVVLLLQLQRKKLTFQFFSFTKSQSLHWSPTSHWIPKAGRYNLQRARLFENFVYVR